MRFAIFAAAALASCATAANAGHRTQPAAFTAQQRADMAEDLLCGPNGATGWAETGPICRTEGWDADSSVYRDPIYSAYRVVDLNVREDLMRFLQHGCGQPYLTFVVANRSFSCIRDEQQRRWTLIESRP